MRPIRDIRDVDGWLWAERFGCGGVAIASRLAEVGVTAYAPRIREDDGRWRSAFGRWLFVRPGPWPESLHDRWRPLHRDQRWFAFTDDEIDAVREQERAGWPRPEPPPRERFAAGTAIIVVSGPLTGVGGVAWRDDGRFVKAALPIGHCWLPAGCVAAA
jgi:hypothetical protein